MKKTFIGCIVILFLAQACASPTPLPTTEPTEPIEPTVSVTETPVEDTTSRLARLGGVPCPDSDFTCITLTVPLDHFNPQDKRTLDVVFGVLPAAGERKGMFVTATGGPGVAGLTSADGYTAAFDPSIPEHFDIVFFDQRGVGQSGGLQCAQATAVYYRTEADASTADGEAALVKAAQTFAEDCVREMGNPEILPFLATDQAVEDLEAFRQILGDDKFWLYGESYGTQYAQTYAAVYGDHLAALIVDGTVDLTLPSDEFLAGQAGAFGDTLLMTLEACNADEFCAESMGGGDAIAAYDRLAARLKNGPLAYDFPLPSGGKASREMTFADLETAASSYMYSESARMLFLRALAAYSQNEDLAPLARILYDSLYLDPETLEAIPDPTYSDAVYYAVECRDYSYFSGTPEQRADAFLRAGDTVDSKVPRLSSIFYGDFPCVFWPDSEMDEFRPAPLTADGFPTLVLGATADPATPYFNGQNVFSRLTDGYMVTKTGGPHIIFGWGDACVDDLVTAFLVNDEMPEQRETICEGEITRDFVLPAPASAAQFANPLEALRSVDNEIYYLPEYYYWDMATPTSIGCPFGGTLTFEPTDTGDTLSFVDCAFAEGFTMNGGGANNFEEGTFTLEVIVTGLKQGSLTYTRDGNDEIRVTGTYGDETVDLSE